MDTAAVIDFPRAGARDPSDLPDDTLDVRAAALAEIDAAIELVRRGVATRVRLTSIPFVELAAATGLAHAADAGVLFRFERAERLGVATLTLGPRAD